MNADRHDTDDAMASPEDEPLRHPWIWWTYVVLFGLSIPWYFPAGRLQRTWLGLPLWTTVSILATVAVAFFTTFVIQRHWSDEGAGKAGKAGKNR